MLHLGYSFKLMPKFKNDLGFWIICSKMGVFVLSLCQLNKKKMKTNNNAILQFQQYMPVKKRKLSLPATKFFKCEGNCKNKQKQIVKTEFLKF